MVGLTKGQIESSSSEESESESTESKKDKLYVAPRERQESSSSEDETSSECSNTSDSSELEDDDFETFLETKTPLKSQQNKKGNRFLNENSLEGHISVKRNNDKKSNRLKWDKTIFETDMTESEEEIEQITEYETEENFQNENTTCTTIYSPLRATNIDNTPIGKTCSVI